MKMTIRVVIAIVLAVSLGISAYGQFSFSSLGPGGAYIQNFNGLSTTDFFLQDNVSFTGIYAFCTSCNTSPNFFRADTGLLASAEFKNYGLSADPDRCFGSLVDNGTDDMFYGIRFQNDTLQTIASLEITYTGEQWRTHNNTPQVLAFSYQVSPGDITDLTTGTYTNFPALNFTTPTNSSTPSALNGNLPANRTTLNVLLPVSVPPLQEIMIRWRDTNDTGNDNGVGIDDVTVVARATTTAADVSVSGRVRRADGQGIARTTVVLSGGSLVEPLVALTNPFGYYRFDNVPSGESYLLSVRSKAYRFETSTIFINLDDELTGLDFTADP